MPIRDHLSSALNAAARAYLRWWIGEPNPVDIRDPRGLLRFLQALGPNIVEMAVFFGAASTIINQHACAEDLSTWGWLLCKRPAIPPAVLAVIIGAIFRFSRLSAAAELVIADNLFSESRRPETWGSAKDPIGIALQAIAFFLTYLAIAWLAGNLVAVSGLLLLVACFDWNTRRIIKKQMEKYFEDEAFDPLPNDANYLSISRCRDVVRWYLDKKPHLQKEALKVAGIAVSFLLAVAWDRCNHSWMRTLSYTILIATLVVNEVVTLRWRSERDRRLERNVEIARKRLKEVGK